MKIGTVCDCELQEAVYMAARIHSMWGNWSGSLQAAERVLEVWTCHIGAMLIKAEALYNLCQFEHAMVQFYRGDVSLDVLSRTSDTTLLRCLSN